MNQLIAQFLETFMRWTNIFRNEKLRVLLKYYFGLVCSHLMFSDPELAHKRHAAQFPKHRRWPEFARNCECYLRLCAFAKYVHIPDKHERAKIAVRRVARRPK